MYHLVISMSNHDHTYNVCIASFVLMLYDGAVSSPGWRILRAQFVWVAVYVWLCMDMYSYLCLSRYV